jgi:regulator of RNase E activity RraA
VSDDSHLFATLKERLYTPVVGDVLDAMGLYCQFLPPEVRPLLPDMVVVVRAMPVVIADVCGPQAQPFGRLTEALDQLRPGEVYVANNARAPTAAWGEILTATARSRGATGAVIDGYHRDTVGVIDQHWPVFSRGSYAQDAAVRKSVVDFRTPIPCGQATISPGDVIFGDRDGVVVIPRAVATEVVERSEEKARIERAVKDDVKNGMPATEAFRKYGVL